MASRPRHRGAIPSKPLFLLVSAVVLAGVGMALLYRSASEPAEVRGAGVPPGMVGVPVATLDLPSYTEIHLEHLLDPATGQLAAVYLPEESILDSTIVDPRELLGRVLARKKSAARVFRESDLMPVGTRPGVVAGIPAGKRALRIDASKVSGIIGLRQGDRFDLVATYPTNPRRSAVESVYGGGPASGMKRARSAVVADGATVVSALENRSVPGARAGRTGVIVQEMVIALGPDEIPRVTEALEIAKRIDCIPRSGLPGDSRPEEAVVGARSARPSPYDEPVIDVIEGERRSLRFVPGRVLPGVGAGPAQAGR
jgi:Flp pilus assembly protein CpaB